MASSSWGICLNCRHWGNDPLGRVTPWPEVKHPSLFQRMEDDALARGIPVYKYELRGKVCAAKTDTTLITASHHGCDKFTRREDLPE